MKHKNKVYFFTCKQFLFFSIKEKLKLKDISVIQIIIITSFFKFYNDNFFVIFRNFRVGNTYTLNYLYADFYNMSTQDQLNYDKIAQAIDFISQNYKQQPSLDDIAASVHLSPFHFQRMFTDWAGVSPKQFVQFLNIDYAKKLLNQSNMNIADATSEVGLSSSGRLHDLFVKIEGMTPGEYKNGGADLTIKYQFAPTIFGTVLVASTHRGICGMHFADNREQVLELVKEQFQKANFIEQEDNFHQQALSFFKRDKSNPTAIQLHIKGTPFQLNVWQMLLTIPEGCLSTYGKIAQQIDNPKAYRAVGTAIGQNPVSFLIPCHRVIQTSGALGGYMWGLTRKEAIIGWEGAQFEL
jgi:AraC family transcriptional regulator of adaptative response/methylated-DNA-[protein]-cysteine methyltransferase